MDDRTPELSRRDALVLGVLGAGALGAGANLGAAGTAAGPAAAASDAPASHPAGTTLARTLLRGDAGVGGYVHQVVGPGEPYLLRTDLGGTAAPGRRAVRRPLAAFVQFTDLHVLDAQSPARFEFLDRLADTRTPPPFQAAYRPHEMMSLQVADAAGLRVPWYAVHGNHDGLVTGNAPINPALNALAIGRVKPLGLPPATDPTTFARQLLTDSTAALSALREAAGAPVRIVVADPDRRLVTRADVVAAHFTTTGTPAGHGFTTANRTTGTAYYVTDLPGLRAGGRTGSPLRMVVMDTVNDNGEADGSLDATQHAWLQAVLAAAPTRLTIVVSHHTSDSMGNDRVSAAYPSPRVLGREVIATLLAHPQVVAWVNGHRHLNAVTPRRRTGGVGGLWEITTASHIDWPQQVRTIEIVDNTDGTLSIVGTIIDSAAPLGWHGEVGSPLELASLSRELAANDPQGYDSPDPAADGRRGTRRDRNVELLLPVPARVVLPTAP